MGHPIVGDTTYGDADHTVPRMCLHAQSLRLRLAPPQNAVAAPADAPAPDVGGAAAETAAAETTAAAAAAAEAPAAAGSRGGEARGKRYRGRQEVLPVAGGGAGGEGEVVLEVVAPDPFVFVDGELQL